MWDTKQSTAPKISSRSAASERQSAITATINLEQSTSPSLWQQWTQYTACELKAPYSSYHDEPGGIRTNLLLHHRVLSIWCSQTTASPALLRRMSLWRSSHHKRSAIRTSSSCSCHQPWRWSLHPHCRSWWTSWYNESVAWKWCKRKHTNTSTK